MTTLQQKLHNRRGRPAVAGAPRDQRLQVCVTPDELEALKAAAKVLGIGLGEYVRRKVLPSTAPSSGT